MDWKRSRVRFDLRGSDWGRSFGAGSMVDLDATLGGTPIRDLVRPEWFEPIDAPVPPPSDARSRSRRTRTAEPPTAVTGTEEE